jgi:hypothetical protein
MNIMKTNNRSLSSSLQFHLLKNYEFEIFCVGIMIREEDEEILWSSTTTTMKIH